MIMEDLAAHTAAQAVNGSSLYRQVASRISELVEHGTLRPGERVPSVRKCSQQQNVSIATVMQAYRLLESQGVLEARPQSGYYVKTRRWIPHPEPAMSKPAPRAVKVQVSDLVLQVVKAGRDQNVVRLGDPRLQPTALTRRRAIPRCACKSPGVPWKPAARSRRMTLSRR